MLQGAAVWLAEVRLPQVLRQGIVKALHALRRPLIQPVLPERPSTAAIQNLIEPLSERELEILRLVNAGLSNSEIAEKVIVTVGTVKKHLNNIFGKLGVGSRTQSLVRARELQF